METVYLETTFISYLVALPSRDLIVAAHQQVTNDWWKNQKKKFVLYPDFKCQRYALQKIYWRILKMINDPIVNEIRKIRDELAKQFNYVDAIFSDLREKEKKYGNRIVNLREQRKGEQASAPDAKSGGV